MNVAIFSPFRNAERRVPAYIEAVNDLDWPRDGLRFVALENDSEDRTWPFLLDWFLSDDRVSLNRVETGRQKWGSVVDAGRFAHLAHLFNMGLQQVDMKWSEAVLVLPSDIDFEPDLLRRLAAWDLVAPFVWQGPIFYDTWAFVRDGVHFENFPRRKARQYGELPIEMDSVGGTFLVRAEVLRAGARFTAEEVDRGLCQFARANGFKVWADPTTHVEHLGWS
jgi:hypothetical protein